MADMFGAPIGISAAEADARQNVLGGLNALKTMGEIGMQPTDMALKAAHARYYNAEALQKEVDAKQMAALAAASPGAFAGAPVGGAAGSLADPFVRLANIAGNIGAVKKAGDFAALARDISLKEQEILTSKSNQTLHELDARRKQLEENGSIAFYMAQSPSNYANGRAYLAGKGHDISDLPEDYNAARGQLEATYSASVKGSDALHAKAKAVVDAAEVKKFNAQAAAAGASAAASTGRARNLQQIYNLRAKNDGDVSTASQDLKKARTTAAADASKARADVQAARDRAKFPPPTPAQIADPTKLTVGQSYSTPKGVLTWGGLARGWLPMRAQPATSTATSIAAPEPEEIQEE